MRLTTSQLSDKLNHDDRRVRNTALYCLADTYPMDPAIMQRAIAVIEKLGFAESFDFPWGLGQLAQSPATIQWTLAQIERLQPNQDPDETWNRLLTSLLCKTAPELLLSHREEIERLMQNGLLPTEGSSVQQLQATLALATLPSETLWQKLEALCETYKDAFGFDTDTPQLEALVHLLGHDPLQKDRVLEILEADFDASESSSMSWLEPQAAKMAGSLRLSAATALLVKKMCIVDAEILTEACCRSLSKIGTDQVVEHIQQTYREANEFFHWYAPSVLGTIHTPRSIEVSRELFDWQSDKALKLMAASALLQHYDTELMDLIVPFVESLDLDNFSFSDIFYDLCNSALMLEYQTDKIEAWEAKRREGLFSMRQRSPFRASDTLDHQAFDEREADEDYEPYVRPQPVVAGPRIGRNDPCPCGSGKKYKKCCQQ